MKTADIKYNLSTDYKKLYQLLHNGITVVGFHEKSKEYSKLIEIVYVIK